MPTLLSHNLGHILFNMDRLRAENERRIPVSIINKFDDFLDRRLYKNVPKSWFNLPTRLIFRNQSGELVEYNVRGERSIRNGEFTTWAKNFMKSYALLHGLKCESSWTCEVNPCVRDPNSEICIS